MVCRGGADDMREVQGETWKKCDVLKCLGHMVASDCGIRQECLMTKPKMWAVFIRIRGVLEFVQLVSRLSSLYYCGRFFVQLIGNLADGPLLSPLLWIWKPHKSVWFPDSLAFRGALLRTGSPLSVVVDDWQGTSAPELACGVRLGLCGVLLGMSMSLGGLGF